ncbi:MAG: type II toxin-antitoxin system death-on-curing family toxin [Luteitalea sp.]|nr:type II toxin-antitoxin system death-on-curing family toxin [Luteitalea sp.]
MVVYLSMSQVLELHAAQIAHYGGAKDLRDRGALEAALARPAMTFGGEDLYADVPAKAAALLHSLVLNHPFLDGNKRVGAHAAVLFLTVNDVELLATPEALVAVTLATAEGKVEPEALAIWFRQHSRSL